MLVSSQAGRLLSRSSLRLLSIQTSSSLRAARIPFRATASPSICSRTFSLYRALQQSQAEAEHDIEEAKDAGSELTTFKQLADAGVIHPKIISTITDRMNIHTMTDVQRLTINECLDGSDVIGQARTGTGKTIAFLMPIIQRLMRDTTLTRGPPSAGDTRALIISPTRELAEQIAVEANKIVSGTGIKVQTAVGGTQKRYHLEQMRRYGCHILVGTPGRVMDLISDNSSGVTLNNIQTFVLDEADRLLDVGFADDIAEMTRFMPPREQRHRQTLMFSATVPKSVVGLVRSTLRPDFKFIRATDPDETPVHERIPQHIVYMNGLENTVPTILEIATKAIDAHKLDPANNMPFKGIVFLSSTAEVSLTKLWLDNLRAPNSAPGQMFQKHPLSPCEIFEMSSKLTQRDRTRNSESFRRCTSGILVSSDVSARGMDFPGVSHVICVGLPSTEDQYVHRIGRTGRAGKPGTGYLLALKDERRAWERLYSRNLKLSEDTSLHTASLDMTKGAQLPSNIARIMGMVEVGIRQVPFGAKADAYRASIGVQSQSKADRTKQDVVDKVNAVSRWGWGMETPPPLSRTTVEKLGFARTTGLNIDDYESRGDRGPRGSRGGAGGFGGRGGDGGFGGRGGDRGGRRGGYDNNDPFGRGVIGLNGKEEGGSVFDNGGDQPSSRMGFGGRGDRGGSRNRW